MKKFLNSNLLYGILAVIMAVFLSFYIESAENPISEKTFSPVNVAVTGLPDTHLLESDPPPVEIRVSGNRSAINLTFSRDVWAYVDLSEARPGTAHYPIQYSLPSGLSLAFIRPESVELTIDLWGSIDLPVTCHTMNTVRQGYNSMEPVLSPSTIRLTGPQRELDRIGEARVVADLSDRTTNFLSDLPVVLLDKDQSVFESRHVALSESEVNVYVAVSEYLSSKSVNVRTALSGDVDERYIVAGVEVQPSTVIISGSYLDISPIESLTTEPIDLSLMTETFHGYARLVTPAGVSVQEGDQVELTIRIERNLTRRTIEGIPIEIRNAPEGLTYEAAPPALSLTLAAYPPVFAEATVDGVLTIEIAAYVDLEGEPADDRTYPLIVEVPEEYLVTAASTETVRLTTE